MTNQTLLVTGIHGLVGQYLFRILKSWPGTVIISGRGPNRLPEGTYLYEDMDISDALAVQRVFVKHKPDFVIHSAANAQPDHCELNREDAYQVNVVGTKNLLEAAAISGAFFIYLSTDFVFSGIDGPYREEDQLAPVNYYGNTKWMAEQAVSDYPAPWAIVRTGLVYGNVLSGTRPNIISWVRESLEKKQPIKVVSDQLRTPTYAADLARGLFLIAEKKAAGVWHMSGSDMLSPWDIAIRVAEHLKLDKGLITKVDAAVFSQPAARPLRTPLITDKARQELGYQSLRFEEAMIKVLGGD